MVASPVVVLVVAAAASVMHVASIAVAHSIVRAPHITYSCQLPQPQQQYLRVRGSHGKTLQRTERFQLQS